MRQLLEDLRTGSCYVAEIPPPQLRAGSVLVRNRYSLISTGTEGGTVRLGQMSLLGKARARPEQARKVIQVARTQGLMTAYQAAMRSLEMPLVLGYCCAGEVIEVAPQVRGLRVGDRVACGGAGYANHAEVVCVPRLLCVAVPPEVPDRLAAFTTLGSIALQGLRVADVRLGENVVVIGLGLVGLLTVQLLRAAGCRPFGIDVDPERVRFVEGLGLAPAGLTGGDNLAARVLELTGGLGADAVIITAAATDDGPVRLAGELARPKARVVAVGRTELRAPRETYLFKELELCTSMAYGPGTGDPAYEVEGHDYPAAYVRWTENRNMQAFVDLLARRAVDLEALITHEYGIEDAPRAFDLISGRTGERSGAVLLRYREPAPPSAGEPRVQPVPRPAPLSVPLAPVAPRAGTVRVGVVGAGSYATNELLPVLARQPVSLRGIASATGVRAQALGRRYGFAFCASEPEAVLADELTDCVFILTRHDSHAPLAEAALRAGKHVFVEKPLALTLDELEAVERAQRETGRLLMVGFNRRYAPLAVMLRQFFTPRVQPMVVSYRANVGYRPPQHWLHDPQQGGGVVLGEACHHIDLCGWLVGAPVSGVRARPLGRAAGGLIPEDNVLIEIAYQDGSLASVAYLSNGARAHPAETVEVFAEGKTASLVDFRHLVRARGLWRRSRRLWLRPDKGHAGQVADFLAAVAGHRAAPLDVGLYLASSRATLEAAAQVRAALVATA